MSAPQEIPFKNAPLKTDTCTGTLFLINTPSKTFIGKKQKYPGLPPTVDSKYHVHFVFFQDP